MSKSGTRRPLGGSGISAPALGVGTNRWDASGPDQARLRDTLAAAADAGMGLFDTAEAYSAGRSEIALGEAARADGRPVLLASKFAPFPYRVSTAQFASALDKTLERLGRDSLDLYYLHFPYSPRGVGTWMRAMARAVKAGKIRAVGISNCTVAQMRKAAGVLAHYGIPLAANQVHYSLLHRKPKPMAFLTPAARWTSHWSHTGRSAEAPSALAHLRAQADVASLTRCGKWRRRGTQPPPRWRSPGC